MFPWISIFRFANRRRDRPASAVERRSGLPAILYKTLPPTHPGEIIREDVLPALSLSEAEAAAEMKVKAEDLHAILEGKRRVDAEWALRLGRFCGNGPSLWMDMQAAVDLWFAEQRIGGKDLEAIPSHAMQLKWPDG